MEKRRSDRRKGDRSVQFPLVDGTGSNVEGDRRSGLDRRNIENDRIAFRIIDTIGF